MRLLSPPSLPPCFIAAVIPSLVSIQASKQDEQQPSIASVLQPLAPGSSVDVVVAGCGPAGIHLAAVMAKKGINVGLVGEWGLGCGVCSVWRGVSVSYTASMLDSWVSEAQRSGCGV